MLFGTIQLVDSDNGGHMIQFGFGEITTCPLPPTSNDDEDLNDNTKFDNNLSSYILEIIQFQASPPMKLGWTIMDISINDIQRSHDM